MTRSLGVNFFGEPEALKNKAEKLEKKTSKFAGKFPKIRQAKRKITPNPLCRTSGSRFPSCFLAPWAQKTHDLVTGNVDTFMQRIAT